MKKILLFLLIFRLNFFPLYAVFDVETDWSNEESVLEALKYDAISLFGYMTHLQYVSEELKNKRSLVLIAVSYNGDNLQYAPKHFWKDREVILKAVEEKPYAMQCPASDPYTNLKRDSKVIKYADKSLLRSRKFIAEALSKNGFVIQYIDEKFKEDKELVMIAAKQNGYILNFVDPKFLKDRDVVMAAVSSDTTILEKVPTYMKADKELMLIAVKNNGYVIQYATKKLQNDDDIITTAVLDCYGSALELAPSSYKDNKGFVIKAIIGKNNKHKSYGTAFRYASKRLRNNREVAELAMSKDSDNFEFVSERLRDDKAFVLRSFELGLWSRYIKFISERLKKDKEIIHLMKKD